MCTIPVDSRFINALVFVVIDVICFMVIISNFFHRVQAMHTAHLLRRGRSLRLRESRLSAFLPPILSDGQLLTRTLQSLYFALVAIIFALTLTINGVTSTRLSVTHPRYLTQLQPATHLYTAPRLDPTIFSACTVDNGDSIQYFSTAFDTVGNQTISDGRALLSETEQPVSIKPSSVTCQNFGNLNPLIQISPCGHNRFECFNVFWSESVQYRVQDSFETDIPWEQTIRVRLGNRSNGLILLHLNVHTREIDSSSNGNDDRLICLERPLQGSRASPLFTVLNCVLGRWNSDKSSFTFRVGFGVVAAPVWNHTLETNTIPELISFRAFSSEIVMAWPASEGAEDALSDGLGILKEDVVTAREFVDGVVARAIVVREAINEQQLLRATEVPVTQINALGSWCYAFILLLSLFILLFQCIMRDRHALNIRGDDEQNIHLDVTDYGGLLTLLGRDDRDKFKDKDYAVAFAMVDGGIQPVETRDRLGR